MMWNSTSAAPWSVSTNNRDSKVRSQTNQEVTDRSVQLSSNGSPYHWYCFSQPSGQREPPSQAGQDSPGPWRRRPQPPQPPPLQCHANDAWNALPWQRRGTPPPILAPPTQMLPLLGPPPLVLLPAPQPLLAVRPLTQPIHPGHSPPPPRSAVVLAQPAPVDLSSEPGPTAEWACLVSLRPICPDEAPSVKGTDESTKE
ncbi:uncharacterized protein LOC118393349 isoform X1 [Oncorhynchus keta]|uniref:uncharacterized protein LOC118393349 isoform X1 n=1 Tax=Oncorhynchus keta TaxID=8018 RepID=UPI0015FA0EF4|nr:uncharacterized protein LOC118393349 isoform X1 [Oncorhynchus keta]